MNEANNPLTPKVTINLQDIYVTSYYGLPDSDSNTGLLRGVLPHRVFGWPQNLRATVPIMTSPDEPLGSTTGLGDISIFDVFLFKAGPLELGFSTGWSPISIRSRGRGTGRHKIVSRRSHLVFITCLPEGFYLRRTATWNFDLQRGDYYIPLGFGAGQVWKLSGGTTLNLFAEPEWTAVHAGVAPKRQIFSGLSMQFPLS